VVVLVDEMVDFGDAVFDASKAAPAGCLLGNERDRTMTRSD